MNFFSGSHLAVAIEDLANQELLESEEILADLIVREISKLLPLRQEDVPRKLINGFMRGSTTIKDEQLSFEIANLQRKLDDRQDPILLVAAVKNSVEHNRKDIHIKRTQKSAVRQILRALKEDLNSVATTKSGTSASFVKTQQDLLAENITDQGLLFDWAMRTQRLYEDLFVDYENSETTNSFRPKGIVSRLAASNYGNSWNRFIKEQKNQIYENATTGRPLMANSMIEPSYSSNVIRSRPLRAANSESIKVRIEKNGQNAIKFEKSWTGKPQARKDLRAFLSLLSTLLDEHELIDLAEISTDSDNGFSISLKEVTQMKIKDTLSKVLAD